MSGTYSYCIGCLVSLCGEQTDYNFLYSILYLVAGQSILVLVRPCVVFIRGGAFNRDNVVNAPGTHILMTSSPRTVKAVRSVVEFRKSCCSMSRQ